MIKYLIAILLFCSTLQAANISEKKFQSILEDIETAQALTFGWYELKPEYSQDIADKYDVSINGCMVDVHEDLLKKRHRDVQIVMDDALGCYFMYNKILSSIHRKFKDDLGVKESRVFKKAIDDNRDSFFSEMAIIIDCRENLSQLDSKFCDEEGFGAFLKVTDFTKDINDRLIDKLIDSWQ